MLMHKLHTGYASQHTQKATILTPGMYDLLLYLYARPTESCQISKQGVASYILQSTPFLTSMVPRPHPY